MTSVTIINEHNNSIQTFYKVKTSIDTLNDYFNSYINQVIDFYKCDLEDSCVSFDSNKEIIIHYNIGEIVFTKTIILTPRKDDYDDFYIEDDYSTSELTQEAFEKLLDKVQM